MWTFPRKFVATVKTVFPPSFYRLARDLPYAVMDAFVSGPRGSLAPPLRLQFDGPRGYQIFLRQGHEVFEFYKNVVGLNPDARILDIGCGIGRKTLPLTSYLSEQGLYVGVDIDERGVTWLSRNITPVHPRFVFFRLDVHNRFYNPGGRIQPSKLILPFPGESFDLVVLWSVFTHMFPGDIGHYVSEIARVLKPGGKLAASYFLMNEHARAEVAAGRALHPIVFSLPEQGCWTTNLNIPEDCIGIPESWLLQTLAQYGLPPSGTVHYGGWSNHVVPEAYAGINSQDIVLASKST